jgi:hypothetical protein
VSEVVLNDRTFSGFYELAFWPAREVDAIIRLHAVRTDFGIGRRLTWEDQIVVWSWTGVALVYRVVFSLVLITGSFARQLP